MSFKISKKDFHKPTAKWYQDYLLSDRWVRLKAKIVAQRGINCEECGAPHTVLHHKTYARLFKESARDVTLLCNDCHFIAHQRHHIPLLYLIYEHSLTQVTTYLAKLTAKAAEYINKPEIRTKTKEKEKQHEL